uniref:Uncharacterized protein n=1 Tax=Tanacetum cinerariifolium TaxID=118510 RepID=A0A6L2JPX4_TANCI|nr:hypothetical protein [Tanacetum cinerariifolium]
MSFITGQQTKLDLELVPKEKRPEIGKCNRRLNPGKKQREPIFQAIMDALALTLCYSVFLTTADVPKFCMHQFWILSTSMILPTVPPKEPTRKSKRVKRLAKKSTNAPTAGVVIRDTLVMSLSKKKEKVTVEKRKGIDLLFEVALIEEAQYEEVRKKSLRDFHKTHPSGSGTITNAVKIKPSVINEGTGAKPGVLDVTEEESTESGDQDSDSGDDNTQSDKEKRSDFEHETDENETSFESDQEENEEEVEDNEEEKEDESVKTSSNYSSTNDEDETNVESKVEYKVKDDEDKGMDYTTNQFDDDVDLFWLSLNLHLYTPLSSHNHYHPLLFYQHNQHQHRPPPTTEATNPLSRLPNFASVFDFNNRVSALEKEVSEFKKDDLLNTQVTALVDKNLDSRLGSTRDEFMSYISASISTRITEQVKIQLPHILPKEVSNFAPPVIKSMVTKSLKYAVLAKESSQPKSTYEAAASLTEFELKKILIDKMDESKSYLTATEHKECYDELIKSYDLNKSLFSPYDKVYSLKRSRKDKDKNEDPSARSDRWLKKRKTSKDTEPTKEELEFEVVDSDMPQDQKQNLGNDDEEPKRKITNLTQQALLGPAFKLLKGTRINFAELEYYFEECYKALLEKLDWENPKGGDYAFDLTKPLT